MQMLTVTIASLVIVLVRIQVLSKLYLITLLWVHMRLSTSIKQSPPTPIRTVVLFIYAHVRCVRSSHSGAEGKGQVCCLVGCHCIISV